MGEIFFLICPYTVQKHYYFFLVFEKLLNQVVAKCFSEESS